MGPMISVVLYIKGCSKNMRPVLIGLLTVPLISACGTRTASPRQSTTVSSATSRSTSSSGVIQPGTSIAPSIAPTSTLSQAAPPDSSSINAPESKASVPPCVTSQLSITINGIPGGADHSGYVVLFGNHGQLCSLYGYPGVDGVATSGSGGVQARRAPSGYLGGISTAGPESTVSLDNGQTASALLEGLTGPTSGGPPCPAYSSLVVTPPNDTHSVRYRRKAICAIHKFTSWFPDLRVNQNEGTRVGRDTGDQQPSNLTATTPDGSTTTATVGSLANGTAYT